MIATSGNINIYLIANPTFAICEFFLRGNNTKNQAKEVCNRNMLIEVAV